MLRTETAEDICISVAWDWMYEGCDAAGLRYACLSSKYLRTVEPLFCWKSHDLSVCCRNTQRIRYNIRYREIYFSWCRAETETTMCNAEHNRLVQRESLGVVDSTLLQVIARPRLFPALILLQTTWSVQ